MLLQLFLVVSYFITNSRGIGFKKRLLDLIKNSLNQLGTWLNIIDGYLRLYIDLVIQKNFPAVLTEYFVLYLIYFKLVELLVIEVGVLVGLGILMIRSLILLLLVALVANAKVEKKKISFIINI